MGYSVSDVFSSIFTALAVVDPNTVLMIKHSDPKEDLRTDFVKRTKGVLRDKKRRLRNKGIKIK